ncbi:hypothetical protein HPB47_025179 [Ixodes persulcatus]|uniref:Uncharacterized protein n=1 Tax=Ixodes persulcatus TaxID=34615 RepID=A0AC60Q3F7_IXOPE|nr:hypothetical protein HPB47_025179 [Ixodes persulcatus]
MIMRLCRDFQNLRGQCFDGAANMSGRLNGVQKKVTEVQQKAVYVHCSNHALDLVLQEVGRGCELIRDALAIVKDVSGIIMESAKRTKAYKNVVISPGHESEEGTIASGKVSKLLPLCPTRWVVRVKAMMRFVENYERVQLTLKDILNDKGYPRDDKKAAIHGFLKKMQKFETVFGLNCAITIFGPCEELATSLQKPDTSVGGALRATEVLEAHLARQRKESGFQEVYERTEGAAKKHKLKAPSNKTTRCGPPRRFEHSSEPCQPAFLDAETGLRKQFYEALDCVRSELARRFKQPGMQSLAQLEQIILCAIQEKPQTAEELERKLGSHATDFHLESLSRQLNMVHSLSSGQIGSVPELCRALGRQVPEVKRMMTEVMRLAALKMTVPASAASAERSFSALRRIKN